MTNDPDDDLQDEVQKDITQMTAEQLLARAKRNRKEKPGEKPEGISALDAGDRVTLVCTAHHQSHEHGIATATASGDRIIATRQEPWGRKLKVSDKAWMPIPIGWLSEAEGGEGAGLICLENRIGLRPLVNPTPEEKETYERQLLYVSFDHGEHTHLIIRPRTMIPLEPFQLEGMCIRCAEGTIPVQIDVFPK